MPPDIATLTPTNIDVDFIQQLQALESINQPFITISPLTDMGIVEIAGVEAQPFLQNQLTQDVAAMPPYTSQLSGYCNAKGRLLAIGRLIAQASGYDFIVPRTIIPSLIQQLTRFKLRSQITLMDISTERLLVGFCGPALTEGLAQAGLAMPAPGQIQRFNTDIWLTLPGQLPCGLLLTTPARWPTLLPLFQNQPIPIYHGSSGYWHLQTIRAGIPTIYPATQALLTPQMVNLDQLGGISFTKGCYPGQEIVARMHYLGQAKRRLHYGRVTTPHTPAIGTEILADGQPAGPIIDVQAVSSTDHELLWVGPVGATHFALHENTPLVALS